MTKEQKDAVLMVAAEFGWDQQPIETVGLMLWALFRYYVIRLGGEK